MQAPKWLALATIAGLALVGGWSCSSAGGDPDGSVDGLDGTTGDDVDPGQLCPPEEGVTFVSTCAEPAQPIWVGRDEVAVWEDGDGTLLAVATSTITDPAMSRSRAQTRAFALLLAHLEGVAPQTQDCFLEAYVEGDLTCAELRGFYDDGDTLWALAARPGDPSEVGCPVHQAIQDSTCPDPPDLGHRCDCAAPQVPTWIDHGPFNGLDGYIYATGVAAAADPAERAQDRARRSLLEYLVGMQIEAGPEGENCLANSFSMGAVTQVEQVCDLVLGDVRYALARRWIGLAVD